MNTQLTETAPATLAHRGISEEVWSAIGSSVFPGASDAAKLLAFDYCKARSLDILKKPCHIVPMNVKDAKTGQYGWRDVIMPGIAEQRITANRTGQYAGQDAPVFGPLVNCDFGSKTHTVPESCTVTVYRMMNGNRVPCSHTEYFEEACGTTKNGDLNSMWTKRKRGQLAKCAEAGALRKAFPEELGGMATADEELVEVIDTTPKRRVEVLSEPLDPTAKIEAKPDPKQETTPATGKQKKDRHHRDCTFKGITEKQSEGGKSFWVVTFDIGQKAAELTTFSESMAESLMILEVGAEVRITFTAGEKGIFALEDYAVKEGGLI